MRSFLREGGHLGLACGLVALVNSNVVAQSPGAPGGERSADRKIGVLLNKPGALEGYTLVFPLSSKKTYLVDLEGRVVHKWESKYLAGQEAYLLENGNLLRGAKLADNEAYFAGAAAGGRVQEFTWDGKLVWDFKFHDEKRLHHHALTRMPNGNVMLVVWDFKTAAEAIAAGVRPEFAQDMLVDSLVEIKPTGLTSGEIVWEWHLWDHLVQDQDKTKANYGDVAAHWELADANFARQGGNFGNLTQFIGGGRTNSDAANQRPPAAGDGRRGGNDNNEQRRNLNRLRGLGYIGAGGTRTNRQFRGFVPDWTHANAVSYNAKLDQVMISPREFSELWIIDHSTTTAEAAGHKGGHHGKGGDLLYRWGNPQAYRAGTDADRRLFSQHDPHWIPEGLPGAGHLLVFNNGGGRPDGNYSSVDEVVLPVDSEGNYNREPGKAFGPDKAVWSYSKKEEFFAPLMAGAQRLPNGNTLISTGFAGTAFEVTPEGEKVWDFVNPDQGEPGGFGGFGGGPGGRGGRGAGRGGGRGFEPPRAGELLPRFMRGMLNLTDEQDKKLEDLQKTVDGKLRELLSEDQQKQLSEPQGGPGFQGGPPEPGKILSTSVQERLKLSDDQKDKLASAQKDVDDKMAKLLDKEQQERLDGFANFIRGFAGPRGGPPGAGPGGRGPGGPGGNRGGPPPGFGFGPGGPGGFGGGGGALFRTYRYAKDYPGLSGRTLTPGEKMTELTKPADREPARPEGAK
jgi:cell division protein ZapA (FtsZ GTPase activity inhibitor)